MSSQPDIRVRIELCDIVVQILCSVIITILLPQRLDNARAVAHVCSRLAVAHLLPQVLAALPAATTEEQVVIDFVVRGGFCAIEDGW